MNEIWVLAGFFLFVMAAVIGVGFALNARTGRAVAASNSGVLVGPAGEPEVGAFVQTFQKLGEVIPGAKSESNPLRKELMAAGYRSDSALAVFYGIKVALALTLMALAVWAAAMSGTAKANGFIGAVCGAGFGFMMPDSILKRKARSRSKRLKMALPPALDMLVLTLEAGQPIDQAIFDTARSLKATHPDLASELMLLNMESRTSNNRAQALRNFAERNQEHELKKFVNLLIDTDRFGSSIGPALRNHAKYLRIRFRQQAQETARKIGVKLIFPVFFLIFPSVILVTLGPAVILIFTQMKAAIGN